MYSGAQLRPSKEETVTAARATSYFESSIREASHTYSSLRRSAHRATNSTNPEQLERNEGQNCEETGLLSFPFSRYVGCFAYDSSQSPSPTAASLGQPRAAEIKAWSMGPGL